MKQLKGENKTLELVCVCVWGNSKPIMDLEIKVTYSEKGNMGRKMN